MLVLTRKKDDVIYIGGTITVMVVELRGDRVRLGIEAPDNVKIMRKEIHELIEARNRDGHGNR